MFKSALALFLAMCLPFSSAVPSENVVHPIVARNDSASLISEGITTDPAVSMILFPSTTCDDAGIVLEYPDAVCFDIVVPIGGLFILELFKDSCFGKFCCTNYLGNCGTWSYRALLTQANSGSLQ